MASLEKYDKLYGLIGYPLSHSFSKKYFSEKFSSKGLEDHYYELFPLESIQEFPGLIKTYPNLQGVNVTIPYKEKVMAYLDKIHDAAKEIGAVNTIKIEKGKLLGYNTDAFGFRRSLLDFLQKNQIPPKAALILGTGGASKAVKYVLDQIGIEFRLVSRTSEKGDLTYSEINEKVLANFPLLINTTPLGMAPNLDSAPDLPYNFLTVENALYDLVYNPEKTVFLKNGKRRGSPIINGLEMLRLQAEKAWQIWKD